MDIEFLYVSHQGPQCNWANSIAAKNFEQYFNILVELGAKDRLHLGDLQ